MWIVIVFSRLDCSWKEVFLQTSYAAYAHPARMALELAFWRLSMFAERSRLTRLGPRAYRIDIFPDGCERTVGVAG